MCWSQEPQGRTLNLLLNVSVNSVRKRGGGEGGVAGRRENVYVYVYIYICTYTYIDRVDILAPTVSGKRDLLKCQKRPTIVSKEIYTHI